MTSTALRASATAVRLNCKLGASSLRQNCGVEAARKHLYRTSLEASRKHFNCASLVSRNLPVPSLGPRRRSEPKFLRTLAAGTHMSMSLPTPIVEPDWLLENLSHVKVLDASWYMPAEKRRPFDEFQQKHILGALFFDIEAIADPNTTLPHMLPSEAAFSRAASALGLSNSDSIVLYDGKGIFSAARAWWMFRAFGHDSVAVLDGGLPLWQTLGLPVETSPSEDAELKQRAVQEAIKASYAGGAASDISFTAKLQSNRVLSLQQVLANIERKEFQLVDARSTSRFQGTDPEPRPGLPSGSVPGSFNVPFPKLLSENGTLLCPVELEQAFEDAGIDLHGSTPLATSCGTGVTACILALALFRLGKKAVPVYDGSWTEWASTSGVPIASKQLA